MQYGFLPEDLGLVDLENQEMMFWLNLPVKLQGHKEYVVPVNVKWTIPLLEKVQDRLGCDFLKDKFVYLTVKTLWVESKNTQNRPGWHSDGFMTDDLNFIWYDETPTEIYFGDLFDLTQDHQTSLKEMQYLTKKGTIVAFPNKHLLLLDQRVIHRCSIQDISGVRSFVKISISNNEYDMLGNSKNYDLEYNWKMKPRESCRNVMSSKELYLD